MSLPKIVFSDWTRWADRTSLSRIDAPGVYVLAHFTKPPLGHADPTTHEVIYIGETCDNSLKGRWYKFNLSAFEGKFGHSGGATYRAVFGGDGNNLFVAAFPVAGLSDEMRPLFIRYVERKLILDFAMKWKTAPKCNRK